MEKENVLLGQLTSTRLCKGSKVREKSDYTLIMVVICVAYRIHRYKLISLREYLTNPHFLEI